MWARRSHNLSLSTRITSIKVKFKRTNFKQDAFEEIMRIVARNTLLSYPDFDEEFKNHTNARYFQLGAVIS